MPVLIILLCTFTNSIQNIFKKQYSVRTGGGEYTFSLLTSFFALLFFLFTTKEIKFIPEILPYSFFFAVCYAVATVTMVLAVKIGSLTLTSLFLSYSLIIPTLNGLIFLGDKAGIFQYIGITALLISIYLVRAERDKTATEKRVSIKWLIYVISGFIANGMCSVIQNAQKLKFGGAHDGNFMITSLSIAVLIFAVAVLTAERVILLSCLKNGAFIGALNGLCNGATNLLVMVSLAFVASSVFFPLISAGGIILTFLFSVIIYKEKFIPRQIVGLIFGIAALVCLNI